MSGRMTLGEFRRRLEQYPDSMEIVFSGVGSGEAVFVRQKIDNSAGTLLRIELDDVKNQRP